MAANAQAMAAIKRTGSPRPGIIGCYRAGKDKIPVPITAPIPRVIRSKAVSDFELFGRPPNRFEGSPFALSSDS